MSERSEDRELMALESALRDLRPKPEALDRAALMYRAGRASARGWAWPVATAFSSFVVIALGAAWWIRPEPAVVERIVFVAATPSPSNETAITREERDRSPSDETNRGAWSRYVRLQEQIVNRGLEGLPSPSEPPEDPLNLQSLLQPF